MAHITKMLDIAVADCDAGRITPQQLISIFQEAIDNGDILEEQNAVAVTAMVLPGIDRGVLRASEHVGVFESRMAAYATATVAKWREEETTHRWWKFWK